MAQLEVTEISNIGSGGMTTELLLTLAKSVNTALADPGVSGAVVTHGTGTLEETAYFLNLTVRSDKPVVVVGAMRPFTAVSRDGPFNLYNAVRVAALPESAGYGVMILLNDTSQRGARHDEEQHVPRRYVRRARRRAARLRRFGPRHVLP